MAKTYAATCRTSYSSCCRWLSGKVSTPGVGNTGELNVSVIVRQETAINAIVLRNRVVEPRHAYMRGRVDRLIRAVSCYCGCGRHSTFGAGYSAAIAAPTGSRRFCGMMLFGNGVFVSGSRITVAEAGEIAARLGCSRHAREHRLLATIEKPS